MKKIFYLLALGNALINASFANSMIDFLKDIDQQIASKKKLLATDLIEDKSQKKTATNSASNPPVSSLSSKESYLKGTFCQQEVRTGFNFLNGKIYPISSSSFACEKERITALATLSQMLIANETEFCNLIDSISFNGDRNMLGHRSALKIMMLAVQAIKTSPFLTWDYDSFIKDFSYKLLKFDEKNQEFINPLFRRYVKPSNLKTILPQPFFMEFYKRAFDYKPFIDNGLNYDMTTLLALKGIQPTQENGFGIDCTFLTQQKDKGFIEIKRSDDENWRGFVIERSQPQVKALEEFLQLPSLSLEEQAYLYDRLPYQIIGYTDERGTFSQNKMLPLIYKFITNPDFHGRFVPFNVASYPLSLPLGLEVTSLPFPKENWKIIDDSGFNPATLATYLYLLQPGFVKDNQLDRLGAFFYLISSSDHTILNIHPLRLSQAYYLYKFVEGWEAKSLEEAQKAIANYINKNIAPSYPMPEISNPLIHQVMEWLKDPKAALSKLQERWKNKK